MKRGVNWRYLKFLVNKNYVRYLLEPAWRWCFEHVPWFAWYTEVFMEEMEHQAKGVLMKKSALQRLLEVVNGKHGH